MHKMTDEHPKHIVAVGALIRNDAGQILMVYHPQRGWEVPGGQVHLGESLQQALLREIREESGLTAHIGPLASVSSQLNAPSMLMFMFLGRCDSGDLVPGGEIVKAEWVARGEVLRRINQPVTRDPIVDVLDFQGRIRYRIYSTNPYIIHEELYLNDLHSWGLDSQGLD